ncbi:MAG: hypothetical protein R3228_15030, partial [Halioglobus sp.]|nr:hypothetical protein [Halioglobus sp.]
ADSVAELEGELAQFVGREALKELNNTLRSIFRGVGLDPDKYNQRETVDLNLLAAQLHQQLGAERSAALAKLLLNLQ